ncbi:unnamed protein product [Clavelina lepadiformis]|uniref:Uncharacterized protein n=1 Tax=Clavelina lepadiformis TaxID=159417 RepID=A0ABP0GEV2_CLALP
MDQPDHGRRNKRSDCDVTEQLVQMMVLCNLIVSPMRLIWLYWAKTCDRLNSWELNSSATGFSDKYPSLKPGQDNNELESADIVEGTVAPLLTLREMSAGS